jgi:hypothetical protein
MEQFQYDPLTTEHLQRKHQSFVDQLKNEVRAEAEESVVKTLSERIEREMNPDMRVLEIESSIKSTPSLKAREINDIPNSFEEFLVKYEIK